MTKKVIKALFTFLMISASSLVAKEVAKPIPSIVYGVKVSPYVRKVEAALKYKNLPYEIKEVLPTKLSSALKTESSPDFLEASPLGKIPALRQGNFTVSDSSVIIAYLEKSAPQKNLYPKEAKKYAKALWFEKYADTTMSEIIHQKIFVELFVKPNVLKVSPDQVLVGNTVANELPEVLQYLEKEVSKSKGKFLVDNEFSIADIAVATHLKSLDLAKVQIDWKKYPALFAYKNRIFTETVFKDL